MSACTGELTDVLTADGPACVRVRVWRGLRRRAAWAASLFAMLLLPACRTQGDVHLVPPEAKPNPPATEKMSAAEPPDALSGAK